MRKVSTLAACLIAAFLGTAAAVIPHVAHATDNPKPGQFCAEDDLGKTARAELESGTVWIRCEKNPNNSEVFQWVKVSPEECPVDADTCPPTPPTSPAAPPPTTNPPTTAPPATGGEEPAPAQPVDEQPSFTG